MGGNQPIPLDERIAVYRTEPYELNFDWLWLVRNERGRVVGFGVEHGYQGGIEAQRRAIACWELRFDDPVPKHIVKMFEGVVFIED